MVKYAVSLFLAQTNCKVFKSSGVLIAGIEIFWRLVNSSTFLALGLVDTFSEGGVYIFPLFCLCALKRPESKIRNPDYVARQGTEYMFWAGCMSYRFKLAL